MNLRSNLAAVLRKFGQNLLGRNATWLASGCLAVYYGSTMSCDLSLYDSGELALAATSLGLGHPPGQPLHTLLGHLLSRLAPTPLIGANLLSALPAALTVVPASRIAETLSDARVRSGPQRVEPWLLALFAVHESLWEPATRVEVYALATLCALCAIARALPLLAASARELLAQVLGVGLALGLCACVNPVVAAASGAALVPGLARAAHRHGVLLPLVLRGLGGVLLGLVPYAYLPLTAAFSDGLVWGGLHDGESYLRYLTLRDYARNQTLGFGAWLEHAGLWCVWATRHLLTPVLILGLGGFVLAGPRVPGGRWVLPIAFAVVLAMISFNVVWDLDVPDYNGYLGIAYWLGAAGAAALLTVELTRGRFLASAAIACCLLAGWFCPPPPWLRTRHEDRLARALGEQVLREAPPHAIVISQADYFAGTLFYLQQAEGRRPDVVVLAYGLAGSRWHWQQLAKQHPELAAADITTRGNRLDRVQRWLAANASHPLLVERLALAQALSTRVCAGGLYVRTGVLCDDLEAPPSAAARELLARQLQRVGSGSPSSAEAIAEVSENVGTELWRLGWPREAHDMLLAGVPARAQPRQLGELSGLAAAGATTAQSPPWIRSAALGDPARNLFLAGAIVLASGQSRAARDYLRAAARLGLPEAEHVLLASFRTGRPSAP